ncbi:hypothetical protein JHK86_035074 [Glycine max]|nr:hypothetical protein JHK86_035074 [Glycine max]
MFYQGTQLPPSNNSDSSDDGVPVSPPRVRLRDGRYLAYREKGVPKDQAKHSIIIVHGFGSSKDMNFLAPQELIDELGIYILQYDRAGYGESDPNPKRSLKSEALDIEELADLLQIGSKFYLIGVSMGSYATWSCFNYTPNRQITSLKIYISKHMFGFRKCQFSFFIFTNNYENDITFLNNVWFQKESKNKKHKVIFCNYL